MRPELLDSHYSLLWEEFNDLDVLVKAGWFNDEDWDGDLHLSSRTTPLQPLYTHDGEEVAILYFTGCFAPAHGGHLHAMEAARAAVEAAGHRVALGLFAPEHANYVESKVNEGFSPHHRIAELQKMIEDSDWLRVDLYPALYGNVALNFTRLLDRLEAYVALNAPNVRAKIFMVFGSDNAYFASALRPEFGAVCVPRSGYDVPAPTDRLLVPTVSPVSGASRDLRRDGFAYEVKERVGTFLLRNDLRLATVGTSLASQADVMLSGLQSLLEAHLPDGVALLTVSAEDQVKRTFSTPTISLDPFFSGDYTLEVSRPFEISSGQWVTPSFLTARPGSPPMEEQLLRIPPGDYTLVDDDYFTGTTMRLATEALESAGIVVKDWVGLGNVSEPYYDVADARDFFPGLRHAGLVVRDGDLLTRVPYALPEVNLAARISLDPENAWEFTQGLKNFWNELGLEQR